MKKTYITNVSLQGKGDLLKISYEPKGFAMKNNRKTSFPIIPVIAENQEDGDEVKILVVRSNNTDTPDNYAVLLGELAELGIREDQVREITIPEDQSDSVNLKLLMTILEEIPEDSMVYGDITFGTKPMSAILLYAMSFVEKVKDCEVGGIYYGEVKRANREVIGAALYDLMVFKLLGDMIDELKDLEIYGMQEALNRLLKL